MKPRQAEKEITETVRILRKQQVWAKGWHGRFTAIANGWKLLPQFGCYVKQDGDKRLCFSCSLKIIDLNDDKRFRGE